MKLAIVGSRTLTDTDKIYDMISNFILNQNIEVDTIVSGGADGVDTIAASYAKENNIKLIEHIPEWNRYGKSAGPIRNQLIVDDCDVLLAFWDTESGGTSDSIRKAKLAGKPHFVIEIDTNEDNRENILNK